MNIQVDGRVLRGATALASVALLGATVAFAPTHVAASDAEALEEIIVTGSSIRGIAPTGSAPIMVDRESIDKVATRTTAELLATLPQIAQFNAVPTGLTSFGSAVASVSLRPNLGGGATLVLINGHRVVLSGLTVGVVDPSNIPPAAIERVEVIADGASAIYGSDAVGGVINFITRRDFDGAETSLRGTKATRDYDGYDVSQVFGTSWSSGSLMLSAQAVGHSRLQTKDLPYYSNVGTTTPLSTSCATATIGPSVPPCDAARLGDLQPEDKRLSVFASGRQELTESIELWADLQLSMDERDQNDAMGPFQGTSFAATNPYNTTGANRTVFYRPITEYSEGLNRKTELDVMQGTLGLDMKLGRDWRLMSFLSYGESNNEVYAEGLNAAAYTQAMAATTTATAFDPFTHRTSADVLARVADAADVAKVDQSLLDFLVKADGPLFELPGGMVRVAAGAELRLEDQVGSRLVGSPNSVLAGGRTGYLSEGYADADREIQSVLAEVFIPVIGRDQSVPLVHSLSLSIAGRHDDYSDAGETTNPKFGVDWQLFESLRLFGTVSRAFQAPPLGSSTSGAVDTRVQVLFGGGGGLGPQNPLYRTRDGLVIAGGSENLVPQTSKNYSYGLELTPTAWNGFRARASFYHIDFKNFIGLPFGAFTNPTLASYGLLAPVVNGVVVPFTANSPEVTQFTSRLPIDGGVLPAEIAWIAMLQRVNLSRKVQEGIDFDVSQQLTLGNGSLLGRIAGSYLTKDDQAGTPGAPFVDILPTDNKLRYSVSLDYQLGGLGLGAQFNHLAGRYTTVTRVFEIEKWDLLNLNASYDFGAGAGWLEDVRISANVDNALNKDPPRQMDVAGGVATNLSPFGRMYSVGLRKRW
jgi:iron complex outermembrane receptor protein